MPPIDRFVTIATKMFVWPLYQNSVLTQIIVIDWTEQTV